jgi:hypothetical protein
MPTMIVLVSLREGTNPEDYERWVLESYAPAVRSLPSVVDWRDYKVDSLLDSEAAPPHQYVVTVEIDGLQQLGQDISDEEMQGLLPELHEFAEVTQMMAERFA